ncbi:hypothetical protein YC2023_073256 [Brassica napus]
MRSITRGLKAERIENQKRRTIKTKSEINSEPNRPKPPEKKVARQSQKPATST